jgi:hypothetical protein
LAGALLVLAGCGTPQQLPVEIPRCDSVASANGVTLTASVVSRATKPISGLSVAVDFYRDFRYTRVNGAAAIKPELDPNQQRDVVFSIAPARSAAQGRAMRCFATRIQYLDGTSQTVAPPR